MEQIINKQLKDLHCQILQTFYKQDELEKFT
jgi:hypothetical protein